MIVAYGSEKPETKQLLLKGTHEESCLLLTLSTYSAGPKLSQLSFGPDAMVTEPLAPTSPKASSWTGLTKRKRPTAVDAQHFAGTKAFLEVQRMCRKLSAEELPSAGVHRSCLARD